MTSSPAAQIRPLRRDPWNAECARFGDHNYRQLWQFGADCALRLGAVSEHIAIRDGDRTLAVADVRCKRIPVLGAGVAYINGGPLVCAADTDSRTSLEVSLRTLLDEYVHRRGMVLRIAPPLGDPAGNERVTDSFMALGFIASTPSTARRYRTLMVEIADALPVIRARLAQKWRNCLNRAERNGLELRTGTDDECFAAFVRLFDELIERKQFGVDLDAAFYRRVQQRAAPEERLHVGIAYFEGQPVAGIVASLVGQTAVYLLGAANAVGMQQKAAYLLQWRVIQQAQERGCRWYDLGGIDPEGNPGVYHFKQGMGGLDVTAPGPFEFRPSTLRGRLVSVAEHTYRWLRRRGVSRAPIEAPAASAVPAGK